MRRPCPEPVVPRRRESPLSTAPACESLLPQALLSEVACTASRVEVVLHDAYNFCRGDAQDVAGDDVSRAHRIIDDQYRQLVTPRAVNPHELAVLEQTHARIGRVQSNERPALGTNCLS